MPSKLTLDDWESVKNTIHKLYIVDNLPLRGVVEIMEQKYGFRATKNQFGPWLKKWGFRKYSDQEDQRGAKIVHWKYERHRLRRLTPLVYYRGRRITEQRLKNMGYLKYAERNALDQAPSPQTPPEFSLEICPIALGISKQLPIVQFWNSIHGLQGVMQLFDSSGPSAWSITQTIENLSERLRGATLFGNEALLPNSLAIADPSSSELGENESLVSTTYFVKFATYLLSNNCLVGDNGKHLYQWLCRSGNPTVLNHFLNAKDPTSEAIVERIFRLAVEAEDLPVVSHLLKNDVSPNGWTCRCKHITSFLTPLQFACIQGNSALAKELIRAGSTLDEPSGGWRTSILVLAICGPFLWHDQTGDHSGDFSDEECDDTDTEESGDRTSDDDHQITGMESNPQSDDSILSLVASLVQAGAKINPDRQHSMDYDSVASREETIGDNTSFLALTGDGYTPLIAASKYRLPKVVDFLLQNGANVMETTAQQTTALHECLYSWEEMKDNTCWSLNKYPESLSLRGSLFIGCKRISRIIQVARLLLAAEADANWTVEYAFGFDEDDEEDEDVSLSCSRNFLDWYSPLDLAAFIPDPSVMKALLAYQAEPTEKTLEIALRCFGSSPLVDALCQAGAPVSIASVREAMQNFRPTVIVDHAWNDVSMRRRITQVAIDLDRACMVKHLDGGDVELSRLGYLGSPKRVQKYVQKYWKSIAHMIENGNLATVHQRIDAGEDIDSEDKVYGSPLAAATRIGNRELVRKLLDLGANVRQRSIYCTKGHRRVGDIVVAAVESRDSVILDYLLNKGADINALGHSKTPSWTIQCPCSCMSPLAAAILNADQPRIDRLLGLGADRTYRGDLEDCISPLAAAAHSGNFALFKALLQDGANPEDSLAIRNSVKDPRLLALLLDGLKRNPPPPGDNLGRRGLDQAMKSGDVNAVKLILDSRLVDLDGLVGYLTPLGEALRHSRAERALILDLLLSGGADPNILCSVTDTAVRGPLIQAILHGGVDEVKILLQAGARLALQPSNMTHVQAAAQWGDAPVNNISVDCSFGTPLQLATERGQYDTVKLLLERGAEVNERSRHVKETALQIAARDGDLRMVQILLGRGADVNASPAEPRGATALQFAAIGGFLGIIAVLLQYNADPNAEGAINDGRTALEGAAEHGRIDSVQFLLGHGAAAAESTKYECAMQRALRNGHFAVHRLLQNHLGRMDES